ncbi:putative R-linalool synthase [Helianthus anomalus]
MNPILLELAKLDFNMVQAVHIEGLKHSSSYHFYLLVKWLKNTRWDTTLPFARDRLVENFLWTIGYSYLPQFRLGRRNLTKVNALVTTIDDVYDVWDVNAIQELSDYMKICFLRFNNTVNEIPYNTMINSRKL